MNELNSKWTKWTKWTNSNEWLDMNELKRMNWNEWFEMNDLPTSSWKSGPRFLCEIVLALKSRAHFVDLISKSGPNLSDFDDFYMINYLMTMWSTDEMELSLQSRTHFVDLIVDLIFKKWSEAIILWRFFCETGLLLQSRAHSVDRIFKTWSEPLSFVRSLCDMELLLTFCRPHSGVNSRAPDRSQDDWHDDVVDMMVRQLAMMIDMMMWLTWWLRWWCGCHGGETASHWQSSVTRKFPN